MNVFDISPIVSSETAVFPGDTRFQAEFLMSFKQGHHLELSRVISTPHIGAHADSSSHYSQFGEGVEKRSLKHYLGKCQVIRASIPRGARIFPKDIENIVIQAPRIIFRTDSFPHSHIWNNDFNSLSPDLIYDLAKKGVITVGIDTPSVDPEESKNLESHQALFATQMAVLEGLVLEQVPDGIYNLIALPLSWEGLDASPVRAILTKFGSDLNELF